ncbi:MAG: hypothetical protein II680_02080, partial [Clostridia bacterium]|nr:hypothetical protein [Clostridia bacterium]
ATTLWEMWGTGGSHNHHMYSSFMSWMMKTVVGIEALTPGYEKTAVRPYFFGKLDWAQGSIVTPAGGKISVSWKREGDGVRVIFAVPAGVTAVFRGSEYGEGEYDFTIQNN